MKHIHPVIIQYENWKKDHPDLDYQYDEMFEFFHSLSRGEAQSFMEWCLNLFKDEEKS